MKLKKALEGNSKQIIIILSLMLIALTIMGFVIIRVRTLPNPIAPPINDNSIITLQHINSSSTLTLEVASTTQKTESGLMFRTHLDANTGMLFIFSQETDLTFWMKDTPISLDMIFLDKSLKVTTIYSNTKPNQISEVYPSVTSSQYVVETVAGWAQSHNVKIGEQFKTLSIK